MMHAAGRHPQGGSIHHSAQQGSSCGVTVCLFVRGSTGQAQKRLAVTRQPGRKKRRAVAAAFAVLAMAAWVAAACVGCGEPPPADMSLLTGEPCEPPCWQGLIPGQSTEQELVVLLDASEQVDPRSVHQESGGCGQLTYWRNRDPFASLSARSGWTTNYACTSHKVLKVVMEYLSYEANLEQLLERYGPPEALRAQPGGIPERPYVEVSLYYPAHGLMCQLELSDQDEPLRPETRVIRAWYFAAATLESLADPGSGVPFPPAEYVPDALQEWQGYGPVRVE
jgi:hypothetical protein